jgi:lysyl-tRNA synthetase class II
VPVHSDRRWFEFLVLDGAQAGLSWRTILEKRAGYRRAFDRFDPRKVARTQPMACGTELGTGFSELNNPVDQRARFEEQMKLREAGDKEAQRLDEDYLEAMEYGMPPATGFGVSERFFAVLMDKPVRETVIFPLMRPKGKN